MVVHELTRAQARRIAVRAQLLDRSRPTELLDVVRQLTLVQVSPTDAVAPSADLVAWSRLGSAAYRPGDLETAVADGTIVDLLGVLRPAEDLVLYRAEMADWPGCDELRDWQEHQREWVAANDSCRLDILYRLELSGPLTSRQLPDTCAVPWKSSGWTNNRNVITLLHLMARRGEVAVAGTVGRDRLWDLAERIYPDDPAVPAADAQRIQNERRLRSLGIARPAGPDCLVEPQDVGEAGEPAVVDGVKGSWRVDPTFLTGPFRGRAALLSPLDRLVYDRTRMAELFEFDYQLEMYKPTSARRWGYFALPILYGDRLVGKVDATADRRAGILRVDAIHRDVPFSAPMSKAVQREIVDLAKCLGLRPVLPG